MLWEPVDHLQGLSGPPGPKPRKSLKKFSRGPQPRAPPRVWKRSRKSLFGTFSRLSRPFQDLFQTLGGPRAPGDFFETFSGFRARRARETPVNGQRVPKDCSHSRVRNSNKRGTMGPKMITHTHFYQERKFSPKRKFWAGHPCGHPARNFGQALQILEKQAFRNGHSTRTSVKKLRSEKLRADFSFPILLFGN